VRSGSHHRESVEVRAASRTLSCGRIPQSQTCEHGKSCALDVEAQARIRPSPRGGVGASGCYNFEGLVVRQGYSARRCFHQVGEWLSLVEHLVRDQGVGGSNPLSPTNLFKYINKPSGFPPTAVVDDFVTVRSSEFKNRCFHARMLKSAEVFLQRFSPCGRSVGHIAIQPDLLSAGNDVCELCAECLRDNG
jgi:hypothetical protein